MKYKIISSESILIIRLRLLAVLDWVAVVSSIIREKHLKRKTSERGLESCTRRKPSKVNEQFISSDLGRP